jgi:hypothetical protein
MKEGLKKGAMRPSFISGWVNKISYFFFVAITCKYHCICSYVKTVNTQKLTPAWQG